MIRTPRSMFGLLAASLALAACTSAPEASTQPASTTPSPSATASTPDPAPTGPVEPTPPPELEGDDSAAAEAFVRYYYDWVNYAQATGDVRELKRLSTISCVACDGGRTWIEKVHRRGGTISGGENRVVRVRATGRRQINDKASIWYVATTLRNTLQVVTNAEDLNAEYKASTIELKFRLTRDGDGWLVDYWSRR